MAHDLVGMDVGFYSRGGAYPLNTRFEILAELGYDATNLTLWSEPAWADLPALGEMARRHGLDVASIYLTIDLSAPGSAEWNRALDTIGSVDATRTVELALLNESGERSDAALDADARRFLDAALERARSNGVRLLLYPHTFAWMERPGDALRLASAYDTTDLGITFAAFHWYAADGDDLPGTLAALAPFLGMVNTNGSRPVAGSYFPATIEPIGDGEFDNFHLLGLLRDVGYTGPLGVQSYGIGGDPYVHFGRSLAAVREIEGRLDRHPDWVPLRTDHI
ncbi:sugar phosphate isomerase/epimerase family protein [Leifsonia sp. fls2-241-R2A-40a]|uniref:sugar phosphate isomerase/epimerase family protein n=1 Tax=Leifsonia sp. fls2-241-R2A-40a TaxID=3040290 RepID=UPI00255111B3|nr:sugar phosphate isomerase/epimerase family protein [Leifsonia sp. fls2-241-R2A-40a]